MDEVVDKNARDALIKAHAPNGHRFDIFSIEHMREFTDGLCWHTAFLCRQLRRIGREELTVLR